MPPDFAFCFAERHVDGQHFDAIFEPLEWVPPEWVPLNEADNWAFKRRLDTRQPRLFNQGHILH